MGERPLAGRPPAGPAVSADQTARDLPVLGSSAVPAGTVADPALAVRFAEPSPVIRPPALIRPSAPGASGPGASGPGVDRVHRAADQPFGTPRQRWDAAVAAQPLETPRPLPGPVHAMARAITGRQHPPRYTTGPATRRALAAAGALGATTGSVVHLPGVPAPAGPVTRVLAHELAHTRNPVLRPRFLLGGALGLADDDERQASVTASTTAGATAGVARAVDKAAASGVDTEPVGAGIVERLPVGGNLAGVREVATQAAHEAVAEAIQQPPADGSGPFGAAGQGAPATAAGTATAAMAATPATAAGAATPAGGPATSTSPATPATPATPGGGPGVPPVAGMPAAGGVPLDPDLVVSIVEERLLRELERRGGRWAGVF